MAVPWGVWDRLWDGEKASVRNDVSRCVLVPTWCSNAFICPLDSQEISTLIRLLN